MISSVHRIADKLRRMIQAGDYSVGQRLENERDLAAQFAVSRGTVRQALASLRRERLIISQHGRGNFVADPAFASADGKTVPMMGMMVYEREYFFEPVIRGAVDHAAQRGYVLALGSNATPEDEQVHAKAFLNTKVNGVIIAPRPGCSSNVYRQFIEQNCPVVILDAVLPSVHEDYVGLNETWGTHLAVEHLAQLGHRDIVYFYPDIFSNIPFGPARKRGFIETMAELGLKFNEASLLGVKEDNWHSKLKQLICSDPCPTGWICYSDIWAKRLFEVATETGLSVPQDISIVGFDDSVLAKASPVRFTSVNPVQEELGRTAVDLLVDKILSPVPRPKRSIYVTPHLVIGKSTASVKKP